MLPCVVTLHCKHIDKFEPVEPKLSGLIYTRTNNSIWIGRRVRLANEIHEELVSRWNFIIYCFCR